MTSSRLFACAAAVAALVSCSDEFDPRIRVTGVLVSPQGGPIAGASVRVRGAAAAMSGEDGSFTIAGVTPPYDLIAVKIDSGTAYVSIHESLTSAAPHVVIDAGSETHVGSFSAELLEYAAGVGDVTLAVACSPEVSGDYHLVAADGTFGGDHPVRWQGLAFTDVSLFAIQYAAGEGGVPARYRGLWNYPTVRIGPGAAPELAPLVPVPFTAAPVTLELAEVAPGLTVQHVRPGVAVGPWCGVGLPVVSAPPPTLAYLMPEVPGWTRQLEVVARNAEHDQVVVVTDVPAGEHARGVRVPAGLTVVSPAAGAPLTPATPFEWTSDPAGVHVLHLLSSTPGSPVVRFVTARTRATLAVLADAGVTLPEGADYGWSVSALPFGSVDALATPEGFRLAARGAAMHDPLPLGTWATTNTRHVLVP